jgi:hypothetical protein
MGKIGKPEISEEDYKKAQAEIKKILDEEQRRKISFDLEKLSCYAVSLLFERDKDFLRISEGIRDICSPERLYYFWQ